jgi:hypothetical protein
MKNALLELARLIDCRVGWSFSKPKRLVYPNVLLGSPYGNVGQEMGFQSNKSALIKGDSLQCL